jgi:hypothetical protein
MHSRALCKKILISSVAICVAFALTSTVAYAQGGYQPLTGIPGVDPQNANLIDYVNALFLLSIALGAMLAVIQIVIGGFTYMMTDVVTKRGDAHSRIQAALLGLGILLATFVVLWTINPQLTNLNVLGRAQSITLTGVPQQPGNGYAANQKVTVLAYSKESEHYHQCAKTGGTSVPIQPFSPKHKCLYGSMECPEGQEFVRPTTGEAGCQYKESALIKVSCSRSEIGDIAFDQYAIGCDTTGDWTESNGIGTCQFRRYEGVEDDIANDELYPGCTVSNMRTGGTF